MQLYESEGIIFKIVKYAETSIICDIYTSTKGLRSFIVSGIRTSKKGNNASIYQPGNIVHLISYDVAPEKLARIKEIHLVHAYQNVISDVVVSSILMYCIELSRNVIMDSERHEDLYEYICNFLKDIDQNKHNKVIAPVKFMIDMSVLLGFGPLNDYDESSKPLFDTLEGCFTDQSVPNRNLSLKDSFNLQKVLNDISHLLQLSREERAAIIDNLILYYKMQVPGFRDLKSIEIIRQVL
jgi:DNA repair protein RecO (recombination protein O)